MIILIRLQDLEFSLSYNFVLNFSGVKDEKTLDMIMILHNYA